MDNELREQVARRFYIAAMSERTSATGIQYPEWQDTHKADKQRFYSDADSIIPLVEKSVREQIKEEEKAAHYKKCSSRPDALG